MNRFLRALVALLSVTILAGWAWGKPINEELANAVLFLTGWAEDLPGERSSETKRDRIVVRFHENRTDTDKPDERVRNRIIEITEADCVVEMKMSLYDSTARQIDFRDDEGAFVVVRKLDLRKVSNISMLKPSGAPDYYTQVNMQGDSPLCLSIKTRGGKTYSSKCEDSPKFPIPLINNILITELSCEKSIVSKDCEYDKSKKQLTKEEVPIYIERKVKAARLVSSICPGSKY